jgi:hypothetical protein
MVQVMQDPNGMSYWDVSQRVGVGSTGDDVRLVQYLLARAPESEQYRQDISGSSGIAVSDVDGAWGPQTAAAMSWYEQQTATFSGTVADGCVDPAPPNTINFGPNNEYQYKIHSLQWFYIIAQSNGTCNMMDFPSMSNILMGMPNDGQCPPALAAALTNSTMLGSVGGSPEVTGSSS